MKKLQIVIPCLALLLLAGCLTTPSPVVTQQPVITPAPGGVGTVTNYVPVTNYVAVPSPWVGTTTTFTNSASQFIPPPYGTIIGVAGALFGMAAGAYAQYQNKQKTAAQLVAENAHGVAQTIIEGVESLGTAAAPVKQAVAATALANGNADKVDELVQKTV